MKRQAHVVCLGLAWVLGGVLGACSSPSSLGAGDLRVGDVRGEGLFFGDGGSTDGAHDAAASDVSGDALPSGPLLYVAPHGRAGATGTRSSPLSLEGARPAVRALLKQTTEDITIYLRGGTYRLSKTLVFGRADGASGSQRVRYIAYPSETPVFTSGTIITGWTQPVTPPLGLPAAARGKIWVADVSAIRSLKRARDGAGSDWRFRTLYAGGLPLHRARGGVIVPPATSPKHGKNNLFYFPKGTMRRYHALADAELVVVPFFAWTMNILPIAAVDEAAGVATLGAEATYRLDPLGQTRGWVEGVIEVLDAPGEWVLDSAAAKLYYWPKDGKKPAKIEAPLLTELVRIEGAIDISGPKDQPVRNIELSGITFTEGDRLPWAGRTGMGLQHDWERFDKPTALVRLRGAEGCVIANDRFVHSGHAGLRLDLYAQKNRVESNLFANLGGVGILLAGYGPGTKDVNRENVVQNNYVHHIGTRYWGSSGIFVWQSGENTIAHNRLHDLPYSGIVVSGRIIWDPKGLGECSGTIRWDEVKAATGGTIPARTWEATEPFLHGRKNSVLRNDVHDVVKVLTDGNCIYISGTGKGNVVKENSCHDSFGEGLNAGLRCDDMQHETRLEGNIVQRYGGRGEGIISKGRNDLVNNFLVDLRPSLTSHRGYIVLEDDPPTGAKILYNVLYSRRAGQHLYGQGIPYGTKPPVYLSQAVADSNLYFCAADPTWATGHLKTERPKGVEAHSRQADPLFADLRGADLSFTSTSPAPAMGIKPPTPFAAIGLDPSVHARLIGTELKTTISPPSGVVSFPRQVTIKSSDPLAEIRYTLDGTEPTASSSHAMTYTGPFTLAWPAKVRARAFSKGGKAGVDLVGASEDYGLPPGWIAEGFEAVPVGAKTPGATTSAESGTRSALVSAARAATGKHSLRFEDGPGQVHAYNPHVYYRPGLRQGRLRLRFAFSLDAATRFYVQWRDYSSTSPYAKGPILTVKPGGEVSFGGAQTTVPIGRWISATIVATLGSGGNHMATAALSWKGGSHSFPSATHDSAFSRLDWLGFVANGTQPCVFYVDDIVLGAITTP